MNKELEIELTDKLIKYAKIYKKGLQEHKKLFNIHSIDMTRIQTTRLRDRVQINGEHIMSIEHELHCLCVELGLGKRKDYRYGHIEIGSALGELHDCQRAHRREPNNYK